MIRRPRRLVLIVVGVAVFVAISGGLARWLTLEGVERADVLRLLSAEVRGDAEAMLAQLYHCDARCTGVVRSDARRLRAAGKVLILADQSQTAYALSSRTADTRVAWRAGTSANEVQCITVARTGNVFSGLTVRLLAIGPPLPRARNGDITTDCSLRFDG
jgi:hypothetical protein